MKGNIDLELLALDNLRQKVKDIHWEYGMTYEEKLDNFINNNKFNPVQELKDLTIIMLSRYLKLEDKEDFYDIKEDWRTVKGSKFLDNLRNKYSISALDIQILGFLSEEYQAIREFNQ